jgi:DNA invertase Pin-like site-specific DNA recombinase
MSTELQLKGDSRRRQLAASRSYAEANNLELNENAELEDIGISAFNGANVRDGALGQFLESVKAGRIKPGSFLLVESLDRLSREQVLTAQSLFLSIIQSGINLVTLADNRVYRAGQTDLADLIMSLVIMSRAHEESQTKSHRIAASWKHKRTQAAKQRPMTKWCPAWLELSPDRTSYRVIPERVRIVQQIFADTASGVGMYSIARQLNAAEVPSFGGPGGWHQSYVAKILANRSVLGEFQPHVRVNGKRVADGEPIAGYFPSIIDNDLFYRAQHAKSQRLVSGAGRKGAAFTNLFSGVAICGYCNSRILFENKGSGFKGGVYLICDSAKRKRGCPAIRWRYQDFETSFLAFVRELDLESIFNNNSDIERRSAIEAEILALRGELTSVSNLMEKTYELLSTGNAVDFVSAKLGELQTRQAILTQSLASKDAEQQTLLSRESTFYRSKGEIKTLLAQLQGPSSDKLFKLRAQIASRVKDLVGSIIVAPLGDRPRLERTIEFLKTQSNSEPVIAHLRNRLGNHDDARRYFAIGFHNSSVRVVYPHDDDPLSYEQQITAHPGTGKGISLEYGESYSSA